MMSQTLEDLERFVHLARKSRSKVLDPNERAEYDHLNDRLRDEVVGARPAPKRVTGHFKPADNTTTKSRIPTRDKNKASKPSPLESIAISSDQARRLKRVGLRDKPTSVFKPSSNPIFLASYYEEQLESYLPMTPVSQPPVRVVTTDGEQAQLEKDTLDLWGVRPSPTISKPDAESSPAIPAPTGPSEGPTRPSEVVVVKRSAPEPRADQPTVVPVQPSKSTASEPSPSDRAVVVKRPPTSRIQRLAPDELQPIVGEVQKLPKASPVAPSLASEPTDSPIDTSSSITADLGPISAPTSDDLIEGQTAFETDQTPIHPSTLEPSGLGPERAPHQPSLDPAGGAKFPMAEDLLMGAETEPSSSTPASPPRRRPSIVPPSPDREGAKHRPRAGQDSAEEPMATPPRSTPTSRRTRPGATEKSSTRSVPAIVHLHDRSVHKGTLVRFDGAKAEIELATEEGALHIPLSRVLIIVFGRARGRQPQPRTGRKVEITLKDRRVLRGYSPDYESGRSSFNVAPFEDKGNVDKVWVPMTSVEHILVLPS